MQDVPIGLNWDDCLPQEDSGFVSVQDSTGWCREVHASCATVSCDANGPTKLKEASSGQLLFSMRDRGVQPQQKIANQGPEHIQYHQLSCQQDCDSSSRQPEVIFSCQSPCLRNNPDALRPSKTPTSHSPQPMH